MEVDNTGAKYDHGKLRYDLIPPEAMEALAYIYTIGADKYGDRNWERGISWGRIIGALLRHLYSWIRGDEIDEESGKSHLWHVLWNVAALVTYEKRNIGIDDRGIKQLHTPPSFRVTHTEFGANAPDDQVLYKEANDKIFLNRHEYKRAVYITDDDSSDTKS